MKKNDSKVDLSFEKRRSLRRAAGSWNTAFVCNGTCYSGIIENMSDHGMHVIAASKESVSSFVPEAVLELKCSAPGEEPIMLYGEVRWVHINKTPILGLTYRMGMEILQQSPEYGQYLAVVK